MPIDHTYNLVVPIDHTYNLVVPTDHTYNLLVPTDHTYNLVVPIVHTYNLVVPIDYKIVTLKPDPNTNDLTLHDDTPNPGFPSTNSFGLALARSPWAMEGAGWGQQKFCFSRSFLRTAFFKSHERGRLGWLIEKNLKLQRNELNRPRQNLV